LLTIIFSYLTAWRGRYSNASRYYNFIFFYKQTVLRAKRVTLKFPVGKSIFYSIATKIQYLKKNYYTNFYLNLQVKSTKYYAKRNAIVKKKTAQTRLLLLKQPASNENKTITFESQTNILQRIQAPYFPQTGEYITQNTLQLSGNMEI